MSAVACEVCSKSKTPPNKAAWLNHVDCLRAILNSQNINMRDKDGCTPLHRATQKGNIEIVKYLLGSGFGCHINAEDSAGKNALHHALTFVDIARILITNGISVVSPDKEGYSVLHKAAFEGSLLMVQLLMEKFKGIIVVSFSDQKYVRSYVDD